MKEKKVLILAYYFPPLGMGGVQRVAKFVKYLPRFGWKPYVLTVKEVEYLAKDPTLLEDISPKAKVIHTGSFDPLRVWFIIKNIFKTKEGKAKPLKGHFTRKSNLFSWLFFPDNKVGWIPFALMKGLSLCRREKIDLIFSSSPPPSLHMTAYLLKLLTGIPWIADFRDPWTSYKQKIFPTPFHLFLKRRMERVIITNADRVVTANPAIRGEFEKRYAQARKICLIDQGYDEEDFKSLQTSSSDKFTIGYLGTFSPDCDPEPVLLAIRDLIDQELISEDKIRLIHVGLSMGIDLDNLIEKYGLHDVFEKKGYLSHRDALRQLKDASIFLLVTSGNPLVFPAKVFEYLALKKPILGIVPPKSEIGEFISKMKLGRVSSPEDRNGIAESVFYYFSNFEKRAFSLPRNERRIKSFERKHLTSKLVSLFDEII